MADAGGTDHVDVTIEQLATLHDTHERSTSRVQKFANYVTGTIGRPSSTIVIGGLIVGWVALNYTMRMLGSAALEEFPFPDLGFVATVGALLVALLILTTQRHDEELAEKRARLTLQVAVLSEKKIAKIISLLEEQRRDNPMLASRHDGEAEQMSAASDPRSTFERLERSEEENRAR